MSPSDKVKACPLASEPPSPNHRSACRLPRLLSTCCRQRAGIPQISRPSEKVIGRRPREGVGQHGPTGVGPTISDQLAYFQAKFNRRVSDPGSRLAAAALIKEWRLRSMAGGPKPSQDRNIRECTDGELMTALNVRRYGRHAEEPSSSPPPKKPPGEADQTEKGGGAKIADRPLNNWRINSNLDSLDMPAPKTVRSRSASGLLRGPQQLVRVCAERPRDHEIFCNVQPALLPFILRHE